MKAVIHTKYGPPEVLQLVAVAVPIPAPNEVVIEVHATTVNRSDSGCRSAKPFIVRYFTPLRGPKRQILGTELAGEIAAVGADVAQFEVGDRVFGINPANWGAYAEYVCMNETAPLARMPANMTFEEAAPVCDGAIIALTCLRRADLRAGQTILVYGASGAIGTAGVQLAKHLGAQATAVCGLANVELARSLGTDEVLDYTEGDVTQNGQAYDVVFDVVGKLTYRRCRTSVRPGGALVVTDLGSWCQFPVLALLTRRIGKRRVSLPVPTYGRDDVRYLRDLIEAGGFQPVIDRTYPLEQIVEATRYVETEQKVGNVVISIATG